MASDSYERALAFKREFEAAGAAHDKGLADGSVTAVPVVGRAIFGGQLNFGALTTHSKVPEFSVMTTDGWETQFHSREAAEAFIAKYAPKAVAA